MLNYDKVPDSFSDPVEMNTWIMLPNMALIVCISVVFKAPSNMKAVLQAGWLLTVAVGNFIVLIVAEIAKLPKQVKQ